MYHLNIALAGVSLLTYAVQFYGSTHVQKYQPPSIPQSSWWPRWNRSWTPSVGTSSTMTGPGLTLVCTLFSALCLYQLWRVSKLRRWRVCAPGSPAAGDAAGTAQTDAAGAVAGAGGTGADAEVVDERSLDPEDLVQMYKNKALALRELLNKQEELLVHLAEKVKMQEEYIVIYGIETVKFRESLMNEYKVLLKKTGNSPKKVLIKKKGVLGSGNNSGNVNNNADDSDDATTPRTPRDSPRESPRRITPLDSPRDIPSESMKDVPREIVKEIPRGIRAKIQAWEIPAEKCTDIPTKTKAWEIPAETPSEIPATIDSWDISAENPKEIPDKSSEWESPSEKPMNCPIRNAWEIQADKPRERPAVKRVWEIPGEHLRKLAPKRAWEIPPKNLGDVPTQA